MAIVSPYIHKLADSFYPCSDEVNELREHIKDCEIQTGKIQAEIQYYDCIIENFRREQFKDNTIRGFLQRHETALIAQHARLEEANFATQVARGFFAPIRRLPMELLQRIFELCEPEREVRRRAFYANRGDIRARYWDPTTLRFVCKLWDRVYGNTSTLWTCIRFTLSDEHFDTVALALQRSANRDIDLFIRPSVERTGYTRLLSLFTDHMPRIIGISNSYLDIKLPPDDGESGEQPDTMDDDDVPFDQLHHPNFANPLLGNNHLPPWRLNQYINQYNPPHDAVENLLDPGPHDDIVYVEDDFVAGDVAGDGSNVEDDNYDFGMGLGLGNDADDNMDMGMNWNLDSGLDLNSNSDDEDEDEVAEDDGENDGDGNEDPPPDPPPSFLASLLQASPPNLQYLCLKGDSVPKKDSFHLPRLTELVFALDKKGLFFPDFTKATLLKIQSATFCAAVDSLFAPYLKLLKEMKNIKTLLFRGSPESSLPYYGPSISLPRLTDFTLEYASSAIFKERFACGFKLKSLQRFSLVKIPGTDGHAQEEVPYRFPYRYLELLFAHHMSPPKNLTHITLDSLLIDYATCSELGSLLPSITTATFTRSLVLPSFYEEFMMGYWEPPAGATQSCLSDIVFIKSAFPTRPMDFPKPRRLGDLRGVRVEEMTIEDYQRGVIDGERIVRLKEVKMTRRGRVMDVVDAVL
ncbi:hypothetical protein M422DRAFT_35208 [Sphaerobolus stellatus SS14]|uniref:F-box domain-containing protein n=1 Tax=Sphaerobolus stellatus (strain SS14) TaxID=990650 RepID=A0A0C9V9Z3_SPHS4|nr:hypothetical protein M422DRAFT_35208 [Sphaerobolus stellatus SS14]